MILLYLGTTGRKSLTLTLHMIRSVRHHLKNYFLCCEQHENNKKDDLETLSAKECFHPA
jgi:hypothetical protein